MIPTEGRYAQIEKEALAITWACSKYVLGWKFIIESDHKPLIPLLSSKHLDVLPPRIIRFRLRLAKFDYHVYHVPGKLLVTTDALSRAPVPETGDSMLQEEVESFVKGVTQTSLSATPVRLDNSGMYSAQLAEQRVAEGGSCDAGSPLMYHMQLNQAHLDTTCRPTEVEVQCRQV